MKQENDNIKKNELGKNIRKLRKQHNMSQEELAQKLFISRTAISKWESGATEANIEFLMKMSALFNVDLNELVTQDNKNVISKTIKPKSTIKPVIQNFEFSKASFSKFPDNPKDKKMHSSKILGYSLGSALLAAGFYLTIIVLIVWGRKPDPTNKYFIQVLIGIPLMISGIILLSITLRNHLYFGLEKRGKKINSSVSINGSKITVTSGTKKEQLRKRDITSFSTYYEKLPNKMWDNKLGSPLVVVMKFGNNELSLYELKDHKEIKSWIERGLHERKS